MNYAALETQAKARRLTILGGFHPEPDDGTPTECQTVLMLGPDEPSFWPHLQASAEAMDGLPDPIDRWSRRVIGTWADTLDAEALFPFGGAPFLPFFSWATRTGRIHASPIRFLVHDRAGLFVSFRGALGLKTKVALPAAPSNPCDTCAKQPCRTACPVDALNGETYDVERCTNFLETPDGTECMTLGCAARRICPVSQTFERMPEQSAYHMGIFKGA